MPVEEREWLVCLYDQLDMIEDALEIAEEENAEKTIAFLLKRKAQLERKLL